MPAKRETLTPVPVELADLDFVCETPDVKSDAVRFAELSDDIVCLVDQAKKLFAEGWNLRAERLAEVPDGDDLFVGLAVDRVTGAGQLFDAVAYGRLVFGGWFDRYPRA